MFDATFWVAVSFVIFFVGLIYLKVPQNVNGLLAKMIVEIKNEILRMTVMVQGQLKRVIDAYVTKNKEKALEVRNADAAIDQHYQLIYNQIIEDIKNKPNKIKTLANTKLLFTIKTIERAGDHITNIAEEIFYTVTGETLTTPRPKGESEK